MFSYVWLYFSYAFEELTDPEVEIGYRAGKQQIPS